jgi:hypothetical protein
MRSHDSMANRVEISWMARVALRVQPFAIPLAAAGYLALALVVAANKLPWCDEGWYG